MAQAPRDENRIPTLLGVSSVDGTTPVTIYADPTTHRLYVDLGEGTFLAPSDTPASYAGQALKTVRVNAAENALEFATGGAGDMVLASVQSVTGLKTFDTSKLAMKGSSTGVTTIASANAGASDYTMTIPASTFTVAGLQLANSFTTSQAITPSSDVISLAVRRNGVAQTANIIEIQTEANAFLAGFDKTGKITVPSANVSGLTASEIVITDASKNLPSAAVATYPSLT